jgi:hypothetical protein
MTDDKQVRDQSTQRQSTQRQSTQRQSTQRQSPQGRPGGDQRPRGAGESHLSGPVRVGSPAGVLAVVPHLLGFHPSRSLVVLGVTGPSDRVTMVFRYDLPDPPDAELAADIASHARQVLARQEIPAAIVVGYGPAELVTPVVEQVAGALPHAGLVIREALRADAGRYWFAFCSDPDCCPPEGRFYDPCSHPAAAVLNDAGLDAYPDRAALARTLEPPPGTARAIRQATTRALRRIDKLLAQAERDGLRPASALAEAGCGAVGQAIGRYRKGREITDRGRLTFLAVCLADLRVRDDAWARMDPEHRRRHLRLWTDVVTAAAPEFVPAPASLLAFTAWQCGEGALANVAIERALGADPAYSMALLLAQAVQTGLPPSSARLPMTPEEVALSYEPGSAPVPPEAGGQRPGDDQVA